MFNHVAHYRYLLLTVYLFKTDIANPDLFVCCCRTRIVSTSAALMRSSACHHAGPYGRLSQKRYIGPPLGEEGFDTICTAVGNHRDSSTAVVSLEPLHG